MKNRRQLILNKIDRDGSATYEDLIGLLNVSSMTVRRDVDYLAKSGELIKTLGGAQRRHGVGDLYETSLLSRLKEHRPQKRAIAELALSLIGPEQTIFLDGSTTCLELAKLIAKHCKGVTVVTNSAAACLELCKTPHNTILGMGGECDPESMCFVGSESESRAKTYFVDKCFLSTKGFFADEGTFESSVPTFRIKQVMADQCDELVLLVDSSKFGKRALCKVLDVSKIHTVITDNATTGRDLERLGKAGKKVLIASADAEIKGVVHVD